MNTPDKEINESVKDINKKLIVLNQQILKKLLDFANEKTFESTWVMSDLFSSVKNLKYLLSDAYYAKKQRENQKAVASCVVDNVEFKSFRIGEKVDSEDKIFEVEDIKLIVKDGEIKDLKL